MNDYKNYINMLKSHAGDVQNKEIIEKIETAYLVHEGIIKFFAGVEKQFNGLIQGKNTNMNVVEAFLSTFDQYAKDLAGLKFQISRIKSGVLEQSSELQELVKYCKEEMTFQEFEHCLNELGNVYQAEAQRVTEKEWQKRRKQPITVSVYDENDFQLNERKRQPEYVYQDYVNNGNGTITDRDTGLMWERAGSDELNYSGAKKYINELNQRRFSGHSDWHLPTVDELLSLLEPEKTSNGLFIHPIFDATQKWCWSSDPCAGGAWYVYFNDGDIKWNLDASNCYVRAVRP